MWLADLKTRTVRVYSSSVKFVTFGDGVVLSGFRYELTTWFDEARTGTA